jgi:hypothetical protein
MSSLLRTLPAEFLKLKRTLALRLALAAPLLIVLLQFGIYLQRGEQMGHGQDPIAGFVRGITTLWTLLFLPFYATLAASLLASLDHQDNHWDYIFALPNPRWSIYAAKWLALTSLVILSSLALPVFTLVTAEILKMSHRTWAAASLPFALLINNLTRSLGAALLLISLQFWFSLRWRSLVVPLGIGIAGIMCGIILISAPLGFLCLYPWTAPGAAASPTQPALAVAWGLSTGFVLCVAACWRLAQRDP